MLDNLGRSYHAEKEDLREFVGRVPWTHFVTPASNDPTVWIDRMHERLKNWDQPVDRRMLGFGIQAEAA